MLMKWMGTRLTMFTGGLVLSLGFLLASSVHDIGVFFIATSLMGTGFSLVAPSPAVFLIASWFPKTSPRMIGFYFMAGALGGVAGPLVASWLVGLTGSWRVYWLVMSAAAAVLAIILFGTIRDAVKVESIEQVMHAADGDGPASGVSPWTLRQAMMSPAFLVIVFALVIVQTVVTTMHSVLVPHVASLGGGSAPGALAMSVLALSGTITKGVTGAMSERISPKWLMVGGLGLEAFSMMVLSATSLPALALLFAVLFGIGWGLSWLCGHVLMIRYFGAGLAADLTATATTATTIAVLGPLSAGWVADRTGSFAPIFLVFIGLLVLAVIVTAVLLRAPGARATAPLRFDEPQLVPAE
jgi:MFS family permease